MINPEAGTGNWPILMSMTPASRDARSLIVHPGDLSGLTALATRDRPERCAIWHPIQTDEAAERRRRVIAEQAVVYGIDDVIEFDCGILARRRADDHDENDGQAPSPLPIRQAGVTEHLLSARGDAAIEILPWATLLMHATMDAIRLGCRVILWPIHLGEAPVELQARAVEAQTLVSHLAELDLDSRSIEMDLPFIDLTDARIIDLASRAEAPLRAAWWCRYGAARPCGGCDGCLRWERAFQEASVADPWRDEVFV